MAFGIIYILYLEKIKVKFNDFRICYFLFKQFSCQVIVTRRFLYDGNYGLATPFTNSGGEFFI